MIKKLRLPLLLAAVQPAIYFGTYYLVIWLRTDCSTAGDNYCTGGSSDIWLPLVAFIILPIVVAKLVIDWRKWKISWSKLLITDAIVVILYVVALGVYGYTHRCGCGA